MLGPKLRTFTGLVDAALRLSWSSHSPLLETSVGSRRLTTSPIYCLPERMRVSVCLWWESGSMNEQEHKIISLVLNEMAFEGAIKHFHEAPPDLPRTLFEDLKAIGIPGRYDSNIEGYLYVDIEFDNEKSVFENCYRQLRTIRNNIVHANKAYRPDPPERLNDLLDWAQGFIDKVYQSNSPLAERAKEIKATLGIENF